LIDLYTEKQIRRLEEQAFLSIEPFDLMMMAAESMLKNILKHYGRPNTMSVFVGAGNNGGDGLLLAALASFAGCELRVILVDESIEGSLLAQRAKAYAERALVGIERFQEDADYSADVIIDAMLGIGLRGKPRGNFQLAIASFNRAKGYKVACDLPSGLCTDTGKVFDFLCTKVHLTVTFIAKKLGLVSEEGYEQAGLVVVEPLLAKADNLKCVPSAKEHSLQVSNLRGLNRAKNSHKGLFGHVLIVAGSKGMGGAAILASEAALRVGAGLVTLITHKEHAVSLLSHRPEVMIEGVLSRDDIIECFNKHKHKADVLLLGPGLVIDDPFSVECIEASLRFSGRMVLDAGALHYLGKETERTLENAVLTPHPGEAKALLNEETRKARTRLESVLQLHQKTKATVLLKGAGSLLYNDKLEVPWLFPIASSALATAGTGDVLAGFVAGFLAAGASQEESVQLALLAQARVLQEGIKDKGEASLIAGDLCQYLSAFFKELQHEK
jgi:NAD(P)H-hydrate epimerase